MTTCCTPEPKIAASSEAASLKPRYSVTNEKDNYAVQIELPGVAKDGVNVSLDSNVLTVHARRNASVPADWKPLHRELSGLDFLLRLKLNAPVDEGRMSAKLEDGVLTLNLPVKEAAKPRHIEVS